MKKLVLAAAFAGAASTAYAGGFDAPIIEPELVIEEVGNTGTSSAGILIPLILIALIAAAAN
ncbi:MAG: hypothetical protein ACU0CO_12140 [Shimia sp.]